MNLRTAVGCALAAAGCALLAVVCLSPAQPAYAATSHIYANNSSFGVPYIFVLDPNTMAVTDTLTNLSSANGRGVVAVGSTIYYTTFTSNAVYSYTPATHTNNGAAFSVAAATYLTAIAFDGTNFWIAAFNVGSGTSSVYEYSMTGTQLKVITLSNPTVGYDGLEYFVQSGQGRLIANRGNNSGIYDVYDTNGALVTSAFINATSGVPGATGITFDGTNFRVSRIFNQSIDTYNGTTGALLTTQAITGNSPANFAFVEGISADHSVTPVTAVSVPALGQWGMIVCGLLLLAAGLWMSPRLMNS
jgi:hypothetical protein